MKPSAAVPPTVAADTAPDHTGINHRLHASTVDVIERLLAAIDEESIAKATLAQRVTALGVLSRILKQFEAASARPHSTDQEVIRIEYQDAHGRIGRTPSWAGADSEETDPLPRRGLWSALWQDGDGEDSAR